MCCDVQTNSFSAEFGRHDDTMDAMAILLIVLIVSSCSSC